MISIFYDQKLKLRCTMPHLKYWPKNYSNKCMTACKDDTMITLSSEFFFVVRRDYLEKKRKLMCFVNRAQGRNKLEQYALE